MLRRIDNRQILSLNSARESYPKSKIIFVITDMSDMSDIKGQVVMVSDSDDSLEDLCTEDHALRNRGMKTIIAGSYENGGAIGVQYAV